MLILLSIDWATAKGASARYELSNDYLETLCAANVTANESAVQYEAGIKLTTQGFSVRKITVRDEQEGQTWTTITNSGSANWLSIFVLTFLPDERSLLPILLKAKITQLLFIREQWDLYLQSPRRTVILTPSESMALEIA